MLRVTIVGILVLASTAIAQPEKPPYQMPEPKGWSKESIDLPPKDFAPEMKWKGKEEIRFAPGMFKADAADFFSYAFLFWLPDGQKIDAKTMEQELLTYYRGLSKTVLASRKARGGCLEVHAEHQGDEGEVGQAGVGRDLRRMARRTEMGGAIRHGRAPDTSFRDSQLGGREAQAPLRVRLRLAPAREGRDLDETA